MDRKDLVKKILELSLELKDSEGVQAMMCITDMENAVKDYEKQLRLHNVVNQRELLLAWEKHSYGSEWSMHEDQIVPSIDEYLSK
jgi:hypothetical protein